MSERGTEQWETAGMRGFCSPSLKNWTRDRESGSMKHLTIDGEPAHKVRTLGINIIPATGNMPDTVAYIDELQAIKRTCIVCRKYLANSKTKWRKRFQWGIKDGSIFRVCKGRKADSDELNNPPVKGFDLYADFVEDYKCLECMKV